MMRNEITLKKIIMVWAVLVVVALAVTLPVWAQAGTVLSVNPPQSNVAVAATTQVSLIVTNGVNTNAFDVIVTYDANLLSLAGWSHGGYLSNLAVVKKVDEPGTFRLVCTQLATAPVSGDGILLNLVFRGENMGISAITITKADFAGSGSSLTQPEVVNGSVTVITGAAFTPTVTQTSLATATYTMTASLTPVIPATSTSTKAQTPTQSRTSSSNTPMLPTSTDQPVAITPTAGGVLSETLLPEQTLVLTTGESTTVTAEPGMLGSDEPSQPPEMPGDPDLEEQMSQITVNTGNNSLFWSLLIVGVIVLGGLIFLVIRKKQKEKNKLIEY
jgi:LPXTG-motif cell wall-anchored protein